MYFERIRLFNVFLKVLVILKMTMLEREMMGSLKSCLTHRLPRFQLILTLASVDITPRLGWLILGPGGGRVPRYITFFSLDLGGNW